MPDLFFYKYRAVDDEHLDRTSRIFTHNEVYFPNALEFNDPFDSKHAYDFGGTDKEVRDYFDDILKRSAPSMTRSERRKWIATMASRSRLKTDEVHESLHNAQTTLLPQIGIFSLTKNPNNILMWSHYANSHEGFCLEFTEANAFIARSQEIRYSDTYPVINPIQQSDKDRLFRALLTKSSHWEYEKEWRILDYENGPGIKHFPPEILHGVIFGCRMTEQNKGRIRGWCERRAQPVKFYQAKERLREYALDIIPIY
tara:strand:+ start:303 stop:1070 length:768 start_codon:yes stop_codon:yes gene_type:complete